MSRAWWGKEERGQTYFSGQDRETDKKIVAGQGCRKIVSVAHKQEMG